MFPTILTAKVYVSKSFYKHVMKLVPSNMFRLSSNFLTDRSKAIFICWEKADLLALLYATFSCGFVIFPYGVLGQVLYLIVSIPDLCLIPYFYNQTCRLPHSSNAIFHSFIILHQRIFCLVVNPITVGNFAFLFNCTPVGRTSDSMMVPP